MFCDISGLVGFALAGVNNGQLTLDQTAHPFNMAAKTIPFIDLGQHCSGATGDHAHRPLSWRGPPSHRDEDRF
jgi:hypothetical protein